MQIELTATGTPAEVELAREWARELARLSRFSLVACRRAEDGSMGWVLAPKPTSKVEISQDGTWFSAGSELVDLRRRKLLVRLLRALALARTATPATAVSIEELIATAWPNEQMRTDSAQNRLAVALSTLRGLGLRDVLVRQPGGYLLDPSPEVMIIECDSKGATLFDSERVVPRLRRGQPQARPRALASLVPASRHSSVGART